MHNFLRTLTITETEEPIETKKSIEINKQAQIRKSEKHTAIFIKKLKQLYLIGIYILTAYILLGISLPYVSSTNYITNNQFLTNTNNWSEVEITNPAYGSTSWYATGQSSGGAIQGETVNDKNYVWEAYNNQTIITQIEQNSTINFSFQWMGNYINSVPSRFNLTVGILKPDTSETTLWSFEGTPDQGWNTWSGENMDVSNSFNQDGTYEIRLYYYFTTAGPPGGAVQGYYDEIVLDVTAPDKTPPFIELIYPNNSITLNYNNINFIYNVTDSTGIENCTLYINNQYNMSNTSVNTSILQNFSINNMPDGNYNWSIECTDTSIFKNTNSSINMTLNIDATGPIINLIAPQNNTLNDTTNNIVFTYNVSDFSNISSCDIVVDTIVKNSTTTPVQKDTTLTFNITLASGQHNWSINCTDIYNQTGYSEVRNITIIRLPSIDQIYITDNLLPENEIILAAGGIREVNCYIVASDPDGVTDLENVSAVFYYELNKSSDPDDNNVHYTNQNCSIISPTAQNNTYECAFNVTYYANNGTWICNATVHDSQSNYISGNASNIIQELYAINITEGMNFGNLGQGYISDNSIANITNIGNVAVSISIQGYASAIGDDKGMDCSDGRNVSLNNIRYSTEIISFDMKNPLDGNIQDFGLTIVKQTNDMQMFNSSYWQVIIDPEIGVFERNCSGTILFMAKAP
jgi:hypothetical protein